MGGRRRGGYRPAAMDPVRQLRRVCVFCGSNFGVRREYREAAEQVAKTLAAEGIDLVYGGASVGLMAVVADAALDAGGRVLGVIDRQLATKEIAHEGLTELHITESLSDRKLLMAELSDAFLVLPGGYGTLDELFEMLVWSQLHLHDKPIGLLDVAGYWEHLLRFLDHATNERLVSRPYRDYVLVDDDVASLLGKMRVFIPAPGEKWLDR